MGFIEDISPYAMKVSKESNVLASVIIAQACLESGNGKSILATTGKNLFGVKGSYNNESVLIKTTEYKKVGDIDTPYQIETSFRKYPSYYESFHDLADKYVNGVSWDKDKYRKVVGQQDYKLAAHAIKDAGYASDPQYPTKLIKIIEDNKLTQYDSLKEDITLKKIVIDSGHGGKDPGAVGNGLKEKEIVLTMSKAMKAYLDKNYSGHNTSLTRSTDIFLELSERANIANRAGADAFISNHVNAGGGTGYESFIYTSPSSGSVKLQGLVNAEAVATAKKYGLGIHGNDKKKGNLAVVRQTKMPSVLTEIAFIDSKDAALLKKADFITDMAHAYAKGIAKYLGLDKKTAVASPAKAETVKTPSTPKPAAKTTVAYPGTLIKKGSKGANVGKIQKVVGVKVDNDFGANTEKAVIAWQKKNKLSADGIVGKATWNKMFN